MVYIAHSTLGLALPTSFNNIYTHAHTYIYKYIYIYIYISMYTKIYCSETMKATLLLMVMDVKMSGCYPRVRFFQVFAAPGGEYTV